VIHDLNLLDEQKFGNGYFCFDCHDVYATTITTKKVKKTVDDDKKGCHNSQSLLNEKSASSSDLNNPV